MFAVTAGLSIVPAPPWVLGCPVDPSAGHTLASNSQWVVAANTDCSQIQAGPTSKSEAGWPGPNSGSVEYCKMGAIIRVQKHSSAIPNPKKHLHISGKCIQCKS